MAAGYAGDEVGAVVRDIGQPVAEGRIVAVAQRRAPADRSGVLEGETFHQIVETTTHAATVTSPRGWCDPTASTMPAMSVIEAATPKRLGTDFRYLIGSSWVSNLCDGISIAAGPLLVQSLTDDELLISGGLFVMFLPWLLFGLLSGALADRVDRRLMVGLSNTARAAVLAAIVLSITTGWINVWIAYAVLFTLGSLETLTDSAANTLLPMLVPKADLKVGNARLQFGHVVLNRLAGPPLGAALFAFGHWVPFATQVVLMLFAALLVVRMVGGRRPTVTDTAPLTAQIITGARWAWAHPQIRVLMVTIALFNITFGAARGILVEYVRVHLGLGELGYGALLAAGAVGGIGGSVSYLWFEQRLGMAGLMRIGLVIETVHHFVFAGTAELWLVFPMFVLFGVHEAWWSTTLNTVRQAAVPEELQGRVGSLYLVVVFGTLVAGILIGGLFARTWDVLAPFWFGGIGSAAILVWLWPRLKPLTALAE